MIRPALWALLLVSAILPASAQVLLDGETGLAVTGYNDIRIPGDGGTLLSFTDDLETEPSLYYRLRAGYTFDGGHTVSVLYAPLRFEAYGTSDRSVRFLNADFPAGTPLTGTYVFNSYRVSYRYTLVESETFTFAAGATAKLRDAFIQLEGGGRSEKKSNVGLVPLLRLYLDWRPLDRWGLLVEGDALVAPQGRAEDIFVGVYFYEDRFLRVKAGYRILEGGADNDEVYNFTLVHYAAVGAVARF